MLINQGLTNGPPLQDLWSCVVPTCMTAVAPCARWSSSPATAFPSACCRLADPARRTSPTSPGSTSRPWPSFPARLRPVLTGPTELWRPAPTAGGARPPGRGKRQRWRRRALPRGGCWWRGERDTLGPGWEENWRPRGGQWSSWMWISLPVTSLMEPPTIRSKSGYLWFHSLIKLKFKVVLVVFSFSGNYWNDSSDSFI